MEKYNKALTNAIELQDVVINQVCEEGKKYNQAQIKKVLFKVLSVTPYMLVASILSGALVLALGACAYNSIAGIAFVIMEYCVYKEILDKPVRKYFNFISDGQKKYAKLENELLKKSSEYINLFMNLVIATFDLKKAMEKPSNSTSGIDKALNEINAIKFKLDNMDRVFTKYEILEEEPVEEIEVLEETPVEEVKEETKEYVSPEAANEMKIQDDINRRLDKMIKELSSENEESTLYNKEEIIKEEDCIKKSLKPNKITTRNTKG